MPLRSRPRSRASREQRVRWVLRLLGSSTQYSVSSSREAGRKDHGASEQRARWETRSEMRKAGKNITKARKLVEARNYLLQDAVPLLQKAKFAKFDETVELTLRLGVDPKHADQM